MYRYSDCKEKMVKSTINMATKGRAIRRAMLAEARETKYSARVT